MEILEQPNGLKIILDKELYSIELLHKCFYWYSTHFSVEINSRDEKWAVVVLQRIKESTETWDSTIQKVKRDVIDFKLRDIVTKETQNIRDLLIAKAFAYYEEDDNPLSEISDPVGFHPNEIQ